MHTVLQVPHLYHPSLCMLFKIFEKYQGLDLKEFYLLARMGLYQRLSPQPARSSFLL